MSCAKPTRWTPTRCHRREARSPLRSSTRSSAHATGFRGQPDPAGVTPRPISPADTPPACHGCCWRSLSCSSTSPAQTDVGIGIPLRRR